MKLNELPKHVQDRIKRDNPDVFRPVEARQPEPIPAQTLARIPSHHKKRVGGERLIITLVALRRRYVDDDNNVSSLKPLRDAIACNFSIDDGDPKLRWEYGQSETKGEEGVIVKLEALCLG